jgi:hypothetical protein
MPGFHPSYQTCTDVSPYCPVEATTYGYYPNLAGNALFCAIFAICGLLQIILGIRYKTYTWMLGLTIGTLLEMAGYVGRLLMNKNPWNSSGFKLQIVALVLSPSFVAAGIDLTLKHLVLIFGPQWSRIKPNKIPWIFIGVDFAAIVVQACGGAVAAVADVNHASLLKAGDDIILTGIAVQIFQLIIFGAVALEYGYRAYAHRAEIPSEKLAYAHSTKFRYFMANIIIAYFAVLIRCIYRLPEMAGGWGSGLQRDETKFLILDGAMVVLASICLTIAHPGIFFPFLGRDQKSALQESEKRPNTESGSEIAEQA